MVPLLAGALVAGYFGWLRNSSVVAVDEVQVRGVASADADRITDALTDSARSMTTLNFSEDELRKAVRKFPTVASVSADPGLPDRVRIDVTERLPALLVSAGNESVAAAGDGVLLRGLELAGESKRLPSIELRELPGGSRLSGEPLSQATVMGAAPKPLRTLIEAVSFDGEDGVEVTMDGGIPIRFGSATAAAEKWAIAAAVLADRRLKTLTYVDVRVPERPAVGGAGPSSAEQAEAAAPPASDPVTAEALATAPPTDAIATGP